MQGFIQEFELVGGKEQDDSSVLTRGVWGHALPEKFRSAQIASDAIWDKIIV